MASTPRSQLTPFSYVVLALVGRDGAGPHDLVSMMRRGRMYWTAAESHYYAEPKRLERLGFIERRVGAGRAVALHPTVAGRAASADGVERELGSERQIRMSLGVKRYETLLALLAEARDALRAE